MNLNRVFKSSVRCVNYQVNYIKTSFHYFFLNQRVFLFISVILISFSR